MWVLLGLMNIDEADSSNNHFVLSQCAGLVGADDVDTTQRLDGRKTFGKDVAVLHTAGDHHECQGNRNWHTFRDECDNTSYNSS